MCPEVTSLGNENAGLAEAWWLKNSLNLEPAWSSLPAQLLRSFNKEAFLIQVEKILILTHIYFVFFSHHSHGEDPWVLVLTLETKNEKQSLWGQFGSPTHFLFWSSRIQVSIFSRSTPSLDFPKLSRYNRVETKTVHSHSGFTF